jgi:hypothetical protein
MDSDKQTRANAVVEHIRGGMSLRRAAEAAGVPTSTFLDWCAKDADLADRYARARDSMIDAMADDLLTIADKPAADAVEAQKHRLQVDARKWLLSKLAPKRYGDRLEVAGDPTAPMKTDITVRFIKP